jgi:hypothetical protein
MATRVLEYAPRPKRLESPVRLARTASYFVRQRPMKLHEAALATMVGLSGYSIVVGIARAHSIYWWIWPDAPGESSIAVAALWVWAITMIVMICCRMWRKFGLTLAVSLLFAIAGGVVQFHDCPHTRWLQIMGGAIPLHGPVCHNPQSWHLWWYPERRD